MTEQPKCETLISVEKKFWSFFQESRVQLSSLFCDVGWNAPLPDYVVPSRQWKFILQTHSLQAQQKTFLFEIHFFVHCLTSCEAEDAMTLLLPLLLKLDMVRTGQGFFEWRSRVMSNTKSSMIRRSWGRILDSILLIFFYVNYAWYFYPGIFNVGFPVISFGAAKSCLTYNVL